MKTPQAPSSPASGIDWSQLWCPGPARVFTAEEMAAAGGEGPSRTFRVMTAINVGLLLFGLLQVAPAQETARTSGLLVALAIAGWQATRWLWNRPSRGPLARVWLALIAGLALTALALRWRMSDREARIWVGSVLAMGVSVLILLLWFLTVWRSQQIEARLNELAERSKAIEMARRLAAAQVEPHFLFNTLSSVQHWVQTKDDRAAPLLAALTGYLRATLPLFDLPLLAAGRELEAVRRYLEVMQARLGTRLAWELAVQPEAEAALLPPGLLLTLVENAVEHGIEPQLRGGRIRVEGRVETGVVHFAVVDDGAGLAGGLREGTGLASIRERLALAAGAGAGLAMSTPEGGGCRAAIHLPYRTGSAA